MKNLKILALVAVAVGALTAFLGAGTASATVLCSTTADPCPAGQAWGNGTVVDWSLPSGSSVTKKDTSTNQLNTCTGSTVKGKITNTGSATETVTLDIEEITWSGCTFTTRTVSTSDKWMIHKIAGTSNGTVTSDVVYETTINTGAFGSCIYGVASGADIGTVSEGSGTNSVLVLNGVTTRFGSNFLCPSTATTSGTYVLTSPSQTTLSVSGSGS